MCLQYVQVLFLYTGGGNARWPCAGNIPSGWSIRRHRIPQKGTHRVWPQLCNIFAQTNVLETEAKPAKDCVQSWFYSFKVHHLPSGRRQINTEAKKIVTKDWTSHFDVKIPNFWPNFFVTIAYIFIPLYSNHYMRTREEQHFEKK